LERLIAWLVSSHPRSTLERSGPPYWQRNRTAQFARWNRTAQFPHWNQTALFQQRNQMAQFP
jgi:hypothetical protein